MAIERDGGVLRSLRMVFEAGSVAGLSDRQLLERVADRGAPGAEPAFAALVERHGPMVLRVCRASLADPHDADDAFQAVFCLLARKAGTLWVRDSLGPWLHEVALRVAAGSRAEAARRRAFERRYAEAIPRAAPEAPATDLTLLLHEEVGRLPARYRTAVILCDLEGLTHQEAARRLGWPIGTVKSRQARGRDRLRRRLILRGLAPAAFGPLASLMSARSASAAVSRPLAEAAVRAALRSSAAGAIPATGAALASGVPTMLVTHRIAVIAGGLLLVGATVIGAVTLARQDDPAPRGRAPRRPPAREAIVTAVQLPRVDDYPAPDTDLSWISPAQDPEAAKGWRSPPVPEAIPVTASGTALDTAGRPVAGATVLLMNAFVEPRTLARTATDRAGAYRFDGVEVPVVEIPGAVRRPEHSPYACFVVVATCPGYGLSWSFQQKMYAIDPPHPLDIQHLLPLGEPVTLDLTFRPADALRGTIVDESGRPQEGIAVSVRDADLLDVLGRETSRNFDLWEALPGGLGKDTTGPDGRFRIDGLPSEACCWVRVEDPEFDSSGFAFYAATTEKAIDHHPPPMRRNGRMAHDVFAGAITLTLPTPRLVRVSVVDDDSGEPIAGVRVNLLTESLATGHFSYGESDAEGSLTLAVPPGTYRGLLADPPKETTYLRMEQAPFTVAPEPADQPFEMRMQAGSELIIDAVDAGTGEPQPNALFWLVPTDDSSQTEEIVPPTPGDRPWTNSEGRLRVILRPKPDREYRVRFAGLRRPNFPAYNFHMDPRYPDLPQYEVDPPESGPFALREGETVRLRFRIRPVEE